MGTKVLLGIVGAVVLIAIVLGLSVVGPYNTLVRLDQAAQVSLALCPHTMMERFTQGMSDRGTPLQLQRYQRHLTVDCIGCFDPYRLAEDIRRDRI